MILIKCNVPYQWTEEGVTEYGDLYNVEVEELQAQSRILCKLKTAHIENKDYYDKTGKIKCRANLHCSMILFLCQEGLAPLDRGTRAALTRAVGRRSR